jgi:transposase
MEEELRFDARKLSPKAQEELRKKIVREMEKRKDPKAVAEICECSLRHVHSTMKKYRDGGIEAIKAVKMGCPKGSGSRLTPEQQAQIKGLIEANDPNQFGLNGYLWDRKRVCELVRQRYSIEMPVRTMGDYLKRWGFTVQRPQKNITSKAKRR